MIVGQNRVPGQRFLEDYTTPRWDAVGAAVESAFYDNPTYKVAKWWELQNTPGKMLSPQEIEERAKEKGVRLPRTPGAPMSDKAADEIIERQYQAHNRAEKLRTSQRGFSQGAIEFGGAIAGSLLDPLGLAANFIPAVAPARYAQMVAKAAGPMGRAGVRAGVGAVEGAIGAAALEPFSYFASSQLLDDYDYTNSLLNIGIGSVMGAGLHAGGGAIFDAVQRGRTPFEARPKGQIPEQIEALPPEVRKETLQSAVAQLLEDRPVQVDGVIRAAVERRIPVTREQRLAKAREIDPDAFSNLDRIQAEIRQIEFSMRRIDDINAAPEPPMVRDAKRLEEIERRLYEQTDDMDTLVKLGGEEQEILARYSKTDLERAVLDWEKNAIVRQEDADQLLARLDALKAKTGNYDARIAKAYKQASQELRPELREIPDEQLGRLDDILQNETPQARSKAEADARKEILAASETPPGARTREIEPEVKRAVEQKTEEIAKAPRTPDQELAEIEASAKEALADFEALAEAAGRKTDPEVEAAKATVARAREYETALKVLRTCATRGER